MMPGQPGEQHGGPRKVCGPTSRQTCTPAHDTAKIDVFDAVMRTCYARRLTHYRRGARGKGPTMRSYRITSDAGIDLGTYLATSPTDALDEVARDAGYLDHASACQTAGPWEGTVHEIADYLLGGSGPTMRDGEPAEIVDLADLDPSGLRDVSCHRTPEGERWWVRVGSPTDRLYDT